MMAENPLLALRRKSKEKAEERENPILAARKKEAQTTGTGAKAAEAAWAQPVDGTNPDDMRYRMLEEEFKKLPVIMGQKTQIGTSAEDLIRLFTKGASYGAIDELIGDQAASKDSQLRAGLPGMIAEGAGMVASPITRVGGAIAKPLYTAGKGLMPMVRNLAAAGTEGAALAGTESAIRGGDIKEDAATGGALSAGASSLLKYLVPGAGKLLGSTMSSIPKQTYSDAFDLASKSKEANAAINSVRKGEAPVLMLDKITALRKSLAKVPVKDRQAVEEALIKVQDEIKSSGGFAAYDDVDMGHINKLIDKAYDDVQTLGAAVNSNKKNPTIKVFNRNSLDDLAAYLENTKMPGKAGISASGRYAKDVHDTIKKVGGKQDPRFTALVEANDDLAKARSVGTQTRHFRPEKSGIGTFLQAGSIAGSPLLHLAGIANPLVSTGLAGAGLLSWLAASPKLGGQTAQLSGAAKRELKKLLKATTGANASYGQLGIVPGIREDRQ